MNERDHDVATLARIEYDSSIDVVMRLIIRHLRAGMDQVEVLFSLIQQIHDDPDATRDAVVGALSAALLRCAIHEQNDPRWDLDENR
jgi:hypothetical protein